MNNMDKIPDITQKNWIAVHETLKSIQNSILEIKKKNMTRDQFITNQSNEIKRLNGVIVALKMGNGPTT